MKLSDKILILVCASALFFGTFVVLFSNWVLTRAEERNEIYIAKLLTNGLAESLALNVINNNPVAASQILRSITSKSSDYVFAYLTGFDGKVFAHTFDRGFPAALSGKSSSQNPHSPHQHLRIKDIGSVLNASTPLVPGMRARLNIGLNRTNLQKTTNESLLILSFAIAGIALVIAGLGWFFGARLTRTLSQIAKGFALFEAGKKLTPLTLKTTGFEDGQLKNAFNHMVSELNQAENALLEMNTQLEKRVEERTQELEVAQETLIQSERLATLGQLTSIVSHEMRNPLGTIRASLFTIQGHLPEETPLLEKAFNRIGRCIDRMDKIVDELLDYSKTKKLNLVSLNLESWLKDCLDEQLFPKNILIEQALSAPDTMVEIDPDRLQRALINILDNSSQAILGDPPDITTENLGTLTISTKSTAEKIEISISDTAGGINSEILPKIFEPLYSTKSFGVGLGLPIVKTIMEDHKGGVEVQSELNQGTKFTLWIPQQQSMESAQ